MKLITAALLTFTCVLTILTFGLGAPLAEPLEPIAVKLSAILDAWNPPPAATPTTPIGAQPPAAQPVPPSANLRDADRAAMADSRRGLAAALKTRTAAETIRDAAIARVESAQAAFEAAMVELTEAENSLQGALDAGKARAAKRAGGQVRITREAALAAEAQLSEARQALESAQTRIESANASMAAARTSLRRATATAVTNFLARQVPAPLAHVGTQTARL